MANIAAVSSVPEKTPITLVEKLLAVMAAVERVPKTGWNDFHKYHYATEADLSDAVRSNLARYGVMLIPTVERLEWRGGDQERIREDRDAYGQVHSDGWEG